MKSPETRYVLLFPNEAVMEAALGDLAWIIEDDYHGGIVTGCARNGTPCSLTMWCRPCALEGVRNIVQRVLAKKVTDENGREI